MKSSAPYAIFLFLLAEKGSAHSASPQLQRKMESPDTRASSLGADSSSKATTHTATDKAIRGTNAIAATKNTAITHNIQSENHKHHHHHPQKRGQHKSQEISEFDVHQVSCIDHTQARRQGYTA